MGDKYVLKFLREMSVLIYKFEVSNLLWYYDCERNLSPMI